MDEASAVHDCWPAGGPTVFGAIHFFFLLICVFVSFCGGGKK